MDSQHFAALLHSPRHARSRRRLAPVLTGLVLGSALAAAPGERGSAGTKKGKIKNCPRCLKLKKSKCVPDNKHNGLSCHCVPNSHSKGWNCNKDLDGKCWNGKCNPRPGCLGAGSLCVGKSVPCCSAVCSRICEPGALGSQCQEHADCGAGLTCSSYRCRHIVTSTPAM